MTVSTRHYLVNSQSEQPATRGVGDGVFRRKPVDFLSDFQAYERHELDKAPTTVTSYVKSLAIGARWIGKEPWEVDSKDLRRFKRESGFKPGTVGHVIVSYKQFHSWGALEGYWPLDGIAAIPGPRIVRVSKPPVSKETARQLLSAAQTPNEIRLVYLGLYAGCRIAESAAMRDHHWRGDRLVFVGKGRKERTVPVHPELQRMKREILAMSPKSGGVLAAVMAKLRDRTGARDVAGNRATSHSLRKCFGTSVYDDGQVPWEVVKKLLGHGEDVTAIYAKVSHAQLAAAVGSLNYWSGEPVQLTLFG